jgi:hypothetical protein
LAVACAACAGPGTSDSAQITRGESSKFTEAEIESAESATMEKFKDFRGCDLLWLEYDEVTSNRLVEDYIEYGGGAESNVDPGNAIAFQSEFRVGNNAEASLNPNTEYTYSWTLIRDGKSSPWEVVSYGYWGVPAR